MTFREWLVKREFLSPIPFEPMSDTQRSNLGLSNGVPVVSVKIPKKKVLKKGSRDGDWR